MVVNCAALSVPRVCQQDPDSAMSINVPSSLANWLSTFERNETLLIHLSTDQGKTHNHTTLIRSVLMAFEMVSCLNFSVYEGVKSFYKEEDETVAVNVYGKSKVAAELLIKEKCQNFVILRSSIITGPQTLSPLPKNLPIQVPLNTNFSKHISALDYSESIELAIF